MTLKADDVDLDDMARDELEKLRKNSEKAIKNYDERQRKKALAEMEEVAKRHGFSGYADVTSNKARKPKAAPVFRHPENHELTWSGKGRKPKWFVEHLEAGGSEEDMRIK